MEDFNKQSERASQAEASRQVQDMYAAAKRAQAVGDFEKRIERQLAECAIKAQGGYSVGAVGVPAEGGWVNGRDMGLTMGQTVAAGACIGGAGLTVGRVYPHTVNTAPLNPHMIPAQPMVTPAGAMNLPAGEAFTRETCVRLAQEWALQCMRMDRLHRPADGWIQRKDVAELLEGLLDIVLHDQNVPKDAGAEIQKAMGTLLAQWAE